LLLVFLLVSSLSLLYNSDITVNVFRLSFIIVFNTFSHCFFTILFYFNKVGIYLVAMGTDQYCHRLVAEQDFMSLPTAPKAIELLNAAGQMHIEGDHIAFLKSGKFPTLTEEDLKLVLDRYLLTKVGAFPDCYERLATNFFNLKNEVSALVTCERAASIFYGWGHPVNFHAKLMSRMPGREKEARDAARASLGQPAWTVGKDKQVSGRAMQRVCFNITFIKVERT
jgi:hypothetical protein